MKDPFEYLAKDYIPWMKGLVSIQLAEEGYSQSKISSLLGITQPYVNYYLKRGKKEYLSRLQKIGLEPDSIEQQEREFKSAALAGGSEGLLRMMKVMLNALASGELCDYHRRVYHAPPDCDACMRLWGSGDQKERARILQSLNSAISVLENSKTFPILIPEVNTNFVVAMNDARSEKDVAGVEGRIVRIKEAAKAMSRAEFGASGHLASVLLTARKYFPRLKCAINVKYDNRVREIISHSGWNCYEIEAKDEMTMEQLVGYIDKLLSEKAKEGSSEPDAIVHAGSFGIEPCTYIFGRDVDEVLKKVLDLSSSYAIKESKSIYR